MFYFDYKFVKFFVELPTFDCKICLFSLKITPFYYPKTKFKHTLIYEDNFKMVWCFKIFFSTPHHFH